MDFRTVCNVQAASSLSGGALMLLLPGLVLGVFGVDADEGGQLVGRMLGGILFALGATLLAAREVTGPAQIRVIAGNAACDTCITIFLVVDAYRGVTGALGWALALVFASNVFSWLIPLMRRPATA